MQEQSGSLHIWRYYGYRSQTWLYRLLTNLTRYTPHVIVRRQWFDPDRLAEFPWPADRLHFLPRVPFPSRLLSKLGPAVRSGWWHVLSSRDTGHIRELCRTLACRVLHVHFGWLGTAFMDSAHRMNVPVVVSFYGHDLFSASGGYRRRLGRLFALPNVYFHVTSEALRVSAVDMGADPARVFVVPVGLCVDDLPSVEDVRRRLEGRSEAGKTRILTISRLVDFKAPHQLPVVARILEDSGMDFEWVVIGDGPLRSELEANCRRYDVEKRFVLAGSRSFDEVKQRLGNSDVMVLNAVTDARQGRESLGVSLMEGGGFGLPVVSCKLGGIPEVIRDGETGYLVDPGDLASMAERIAALGRDATLRCRMGMAAVTRVRRVFDSRQLAAKLEDSYDRIQAE